MSFRRRKAPLPVLGPISHTGWLRKQGSKFKTWSRRYFVLECQTMHYYQRDDQQQFVNSFSVKGQELEIIDGEEDYSRASNVEPDKFLFLIKPGDCNARVSETHEYFLLCASSKEERTEWVQVLQKAMYRERGGAIFGYPLDEVMDSTLTDPDDGVPIVLKDCCDYILNHGVKQEGIFRKCSRKKAIQDLVQSYDRGLRPKLLQCSDVHTVSSVLKKFLSDLPEPLIPYAHYDSLKAVGYYITENCEVSSIIQRLEKLPRNNYVLLKYICQFLYKVASHSQINRMSTKNLASIFAPHILRCQDSDPNIDASATDLISVTVEAFITRCDILFVKSPSHSVPFTTQNVAPDPCIPSSSDSIFKSVNDDNHVIGNGTVQSQSNKPPPAAVAATTRVSFLSSSKPTKHRNSNSLPSRNHLFVPECEEVNLSTLRSSHTTPSYRKTIHEISSPVLSMKKSSTGDDSPVTLRVHSTTRRSASVLPTPYRYSDDTNPDCEREEDEDVIKAIHEVTRRMLQLSRERSELQKQCDFYRTSCHTLQEHNQLLHQELQELKLRLSQREEEVFQLRSSNAM